MFEGLTESAATNFGACRSHSFARHVSQQARPALGLFSRESYRSGARRREQVKAAPFWRSRQSQCLVSDISLDFAQKKGKLIRDATTMHASAHALPLDEIGPIGVMDKKRSCSGDGKSRRSSLSRGHPGRIPMSSASSARSSVRSLVAYNPPSYGQDYRIPESGPSASSLRTSRRMTSRSTNRRGGFGVKDRCIFRPLCSHAIVPRISMDFTPVADVPDVLRPTNKLHPRSSAARFRR